LDYEAVQRFKPYLSPHETVRWAGRPQQGLVFRSTDLALIPFSILWCGFAIFWETLVVTSGGPFFMVLWGIPFILVGLYMVFGRFLYDAFVRSRTHYALTQHSALVLSGVDGKKLTTVDLKSLQESHLKPRAGTRGTIVFGPDTGQFSNRRGVAASPEFFGIEDAAGVYAQVQQHRRAV
jgi:hypothetical protein